MYFRKKGIGFFIVLMVTILTLVVTGCSSNAPAKPAGGDAEKWPTEPITIIVPQKAGGTTDLFARGIAHYLPKYLGVPVAIENIDGGAGIVGLNQFLSSKADGSILMVFHQAKMSMGHIIDGADYSLDSFAFITTPQIDYPTISVSKESPYKTFDDLINAIKENPGKIAMSITPNSGPQLSGLLLMKKLGLEVRVVTYESGNENRLAAAGGHVDFAMSNASGDFTFRDNLNTIAVFSDEPYPLLPDAVPINKALEPYGIEVPTGLGSVRNVIVHKEFAENYPERYQILVEAFQKTIEDTEYQDHIKKTGEDAITSFRTPEQSLKLNQAYEEVIIEFKDVLAK